VGDGVNLPATHAHLGELVEIARTAHRETGGDPERFIVTVSAGFGDVWLRAESAPRARLDALGVHRIVFFVHPPYVDEIEGAGRALRRDA
jgi:hypothetical protein